MEKMWVKKFQKGENLLGGSISDRFDEIDHTFLRFISAPPPFWFSRLVLDAVYIIVYCWFVICRELGGLLYNLWEWDWCCGLTDFAFISCSFCAVLQFSAKLCAFFWYQRWEAVCVFHINLKQLFGFGTFWVTVLWWPSYQVWRR